MHSKRIKEKVKQDYNSIAAGFAGSRRFPWKDFEHFLPYFKGGKVLDLGCGNGRLLKFLEKHGFEEYLGVDQSEELIKFARAEHSGKMFLVADMMDLDLDEKFDAIFAIASFHHVPPLLQLKTLKAWRKLLRPGGKIFMTNWNLMQPRFWPLWIRTFLRPAFGFRGLLVPWNNQVKRYYFGFSKRRLAHLLNRAGFKCLENKYVLHDKDAGIFTANNILSMVSVPLQQVRVVEHDL